MKLVLIVALVLVGVGEVEHERHVRERGIGLRAALEEKKWDNALAAIQQAAALSSPRRLV